MSCDWKFQRVILLENITITHTKVISYIIRHYIIYITYIYFENDVSYSFLSRNVQIYQVDYQVLFRNLAYFKVSKCLKFDFYDFNIIQECKIKY